MADAIQYGRALYYPYINFPDINWLKTAALYYEGLDRIVPVTFEKFAYTETISRLNEDGEFVRNISPFDYIEGVSSAFWEFTKTELYDQKKRDTFVQKLKATPTLNERFLIYNAKMDGSLQSKLHEIGLAQYFDGGICLESVTGAMYMTFLANAIAHDRLLPVITNDPDFQQFMKYSEYSEFKISNDVGYQLAGLVIKSVVPSNLERVSIEKILLFRKDYGDERHEFYKAINALVNDLKGIDSPGLLRDCLEHKKRSVDIAVKNLEGALNGIGIATLMGLLGLSVPSFISGMGAGFAEAGLLTIATGKFALSATEWRKNKANAPFSYVLSLNKKLNSESFAQQLLNRKLIL